MAITQLIPSREHAKGLGRDKRFGSQELSLRIPTIPKQTCLEFFHSLASSRSAAFTAHTQLAPQMLVSPMQRTEQSHSLPSTPEPQAPLPSAAITTCLCLLISLSNILWDDCAHLLRGQGWGSGWKIPQKLH